ncbi:MAG TPA: anti-sigma factor [Burkholderiales bacterium]
MSPDETKLLHAYLDGELDPARTLELETRMTENPQLRSAYERLREMSAAIREKADYHAAPARLRFALPEASNSASWRMKWLQGAALAAAILLGIGIGIFVPRATQDDVLAQELVASHVRATLSGRLIDVASSDQHTVKPWLSAHLPFSPPVSDFSGEGFPLTGARVDYVNGAPAAVLVYKRRQHVVDVFVFPGKAPANAALARDGFNVERFGAGGMTFWAVSDLNANELADFARLVAGRS